MGHKSSDDAGLPMSEVGAFRPRYRTVGCAYLSPHQVATQNVASEAT